MPHFDYVANEVAKGIRKTVIDFDKPMIFGELTTENIAQAIERTNMKADNKGFDSGTSAVKMVNLFDSIGW